MNKQQRLGGILATLGAILGIGGTFIVFFNWYERALTAEAAEPGCEILLKYLFPALSDLGIVAGVLYAVSAYGFFTAARWAFPVVVVANVLALQGSWFINVPMMAADLPPVFFPIFWPNVILFFLFMRVVGKVPWSRTILGFVTGMAFVFTLMNGVASWSRILTIGTPLYTLVQRAHWISMIGFGVITVGILLRPKEWMRVVGLAAALLELVVGIPLAIATTVDLGRFSLFSLAPIFSLLLLGIFVWPNLWQRLTEPEVQIPAEPIEGKPEVQTA
jgi:hypothetical protein